MGTFPHVTIIVENCINSDDYSADCGNRKKMHHMTDKTTLQIILIGH